ncbi:hypothetical protein M406DRAFT_107597, partial [Cryphonectria parasitica EP155]
QSLPQFTIFLPRVTIPVFEIDSASARTPDQSAIFAPTTLILRTLSTFIKPSQDTTLCAVLSILSDSFVFGQIESDNRRTTAHTHTTSQNNSCDGQDYNKPENTCVDLDFVKKIRRL